MPRIHDTASDARRAFLREQGAAIRAARHARGLAQPAAAALLGVPPATYRSWEQGTRQPGPDVRRRLSAEWGVPAAALAFDHGATTCPHCGRRY